MQLKRNAKRATAYIQTSGTLAAATCALLGPAAPTAVIAQELTPWDIDTALLYYGESDDRVRDFSLNAIAVKELTEDGFLTLTLALDTLTGASPNGAAPSVSPQTFTRPSGGGRYVVAPGEIPLDDSFLDTRTAFSGSWKWQLTRLMEVDVGASISDEYDYTHSGINARIARDFNNRNTTLSFGVALANDSINPVGGAPTAFSPMLPATGDDGGEEGEGVSKGPDQSKDVVDFLLGITQVLDRQTIVQFNYSMSQSDGYLTDPYKILSVVDPVSGIPVAGPPGSGMNLYLYEARPASRDKQSLYTLLKRDFGGDVFDISYRYMTDDWGIDSHTIDMHHRWQLNSGKYLQPHVRFYSQNQADFYETVLFDGQPLGRFASADHRLGKFDAVTLGIKYGQDTRNGEFAARFEVYRQTGEPDPAARVGTLTDLDLYPDLNAVIFQLSYNFGR